MAGVSGDKIEVVKEELSVGKRQVDAGGVRVTSHVVERPVEETVNLHEERVVVERRPVEHPLSGATADAFRERTIEARATTEEPVISKEARVVEEIGLRKEAVDRVETVHDTVRETKVDVEQSPGPGVTSDRGVTAAGHGAGAPGTGTSAGDKAADNSVTRAVDDVAGTNISGERPDQADGTPANPSGTMASRAVDKTLGTNISGANPTRVSTSVWSTGPATLDATRRSTWPRRVVLVKGSGTPRGASNAPTDCVFPAVMDSVRRAFAAQIGIFLWIETPPTR